MKLGWAHGAMLTTYPGDTTMAMLEQVQAFAQGGSARIHAVSHGEESLLRRYVAAVLDR